MTNEQLKAAVKKAQDGDLKPLADLLRADRVTRRMTYPEYAAFLDVKLSTLNKLVNLKTRKPHDLTLGQIERKLTRARKPADEPAADTAAADPTGDQPAES